MRLIAVFLLVLGCWIAPVIATEKAGITELSRQMFFVQGEDKRAIVEKLAAANDRSLIPTFVLAMRWTRNNVYVAEALSKLTGEKITDWHDAYTWQERHPEVTPHPSFRDIKLWLLGNTDTQFLDFFKPPFGTRDQMKIRLEEIAWGGALVDSIPSLDRPQMINAKEAGYLLDTDLVFGVEINGEARAYPLRIMGWHEMLNDEIAGVPVALAYCTLCGAGILFETRLEGEENPLVFGSSGLLYRSNKLMFDRKTNTLWNQFTGQPVIGPLAGSDSRLKIRSLVTTSWADWKANHPETQVLSLQTGYIRNYDSGFVYWEYFASPELMFPAFVRDESVLKRKDFVFGIRDVGSAKAWPVEAFHNNRLINDAVGSKGVVLIGDADTRTVRAYERKNNEVFKPLSDGRLQTKDDDWQVTEAFLVSHDGSRKRPRLPGHLSYWFAWDNHLGVKSELYSAQ